MNSCATSIRARGYLGRDARGALTEVMEERLLHCACTGGSLPGHRETLRPANRKSLLLPVICSRAITHAAFSIATMRYCVEATLPHPGLVVLDSPLITFRDKDSANAEDELSVEARARLKNEFYKDLATRVADQQVIVFENEEPGEDIRPKIVFHHFTGDPALPRCGFFPSSAKALDQS